jgi:transcriptional regulator with XRE-family HTH domain
LPFCSLTLKAQKPTKLPTILNSVGDHIKKRRLQLGLHQAQVAEILDVDESTITNWEKNRTSPALRAIPKIIEFLGYDPMPRRSETLGGQLSQYRKSRGMNQKVVAQQIGIDPATSSRLEREKGGCLTSVLKKVTAFLQTHASRDVKV